MSCVSVEPEKPAEVAEWTEYTSPEGKPYYHNYRTNQTTWDKPRVLHEWEERQKQQQPPETMSPSKPAAGAAIEQRRGSGAGGASSARAQSEGGSSGSGSGEKEAEKEPSKPPEAPQDKSRPVATAAIQGTPWYAYCTIVQVRSVLYTMAMRRARLRLRGCANTCRRTSTFTRAYSLRLEMHSL